METTNEQLDTQAELLRTFSDSEYGQKLVARTRWDDFRPEFVNTEIWTFLLGEDVNNLYHMPYTQHLAERFCETGSLSPESTELLKTVAITHDWGEAIIGDIPAPAKTEEDEKREKIAYRKIAQDLLGPDETLTDEVWKVLNKEDAEHGDMFRAIEYLGYSLTAIRAKKTADALAHGFIRVNLTRKEKEQLIGGMYALNKAVEVKTFPVLSEYVNKYPWLQQVIYEEQ